MDWMASAFESGFGSEARMPAHVYVHIPFCASKCSYCDFASISGADEDIVRAVFTGIRSQVRQWSNQGLGGVVETVYFGGGTPSLHTDGVLDVLGYIREQFVVHEAAEITIEANPDSLTEDVVRALHGAGVTRVSIGVQSFDDRVLGMLGRRHDAVQAWRACERVVDAGLALSVDLICGVPGQTRASWAETVQRAVDTGARHISVYPLAVEEGTPLAAAIDGGLVGEPDADEAADMMLMAEESLGLAGIERYEVANYAASPSDRSRHNTAYWTGRSYAGLGPAAHGMLDAATAMAIGMGEGLEPGARVRYHNADDIDEWMVGVGDESETLSAADASREDVMLGLRLTAGVRADVVENAGCAAALQALADEGLTSLVEGRWRTTQRGWLLGNEVFSRVWLGEED